MDFLVWIAPSRFEREAPDPKSEMFADYTIELYNGEAKI